MEGENFCEWNGDEYRAPMSSYISQSNTVSCDNALSQNGRNQFCMESASSQPTNCLQELPIEVEARLRSSYGGSSEDLELLNIPSIHETMNNSFDIHNASLREDDSLTTDWGYFGKGNSCLGNALCCENELDPSTCDDPEPNTTRSGAREPLKRLRRQRANDRERRRMKSLNGALNNLKRCIPLPKTKRRVTKLEILRIACHYIQSLWETLNNGNDDKNERILGRNPSRNSLVNGMTVSQRLNLLSNNLKFNFQL